MRPPSVFVATSTILMANILISISIFTASLNDVCTSDSDCASLVNSFCYKMYDCEKGVCACQTGYGNDNNNGCQSKV